MQMLATWRPSRPHPRRMSPPYAPALSAPLSPACRLPPCMLSLFFPPGCAIARAVIAGEVGRSVASSADSTEDGPPNSKGGDPSFEGRFVEFGLGLRELEAREPA